MLGYPGTSTIHAYNNRYIHDCTLIFCESITSSEEHACLSACLLKTACASACIDAEMSCFSWPFTTSVLARRRVLVAHLPELTQGLAPLQRALSGSVLRPWCHFELPVSGYLAQGRLPYFLCIEVHALYAAPLNLSCH